MKKPNYLNPKLPRLSKVKFSYQVFNRDLFNNFLKEFPEYQNMKWEEFRERWFEIAQTIRSETVLNPLGVKLNYYLGELKTQFLPSNYKATNIKASIEEGEKINHLNMLTKGKVGVIKWERRFAVRFNRMLQFFAFESHREMHDMAKKYIPENMDKVRISRNTLGGKKTWLNNK